MVCLLNRSIKRMTRTKILALFMLPLATSIAVAQGPGGTNVPPLELESVTVIGKRMVVLPKARKGEVIDTSVYALPGGDSLLFSERISNLQGPGGTLPGYREQDSPLKLDAEASIGSYLSPRVSVHAEFSRPTFNAAGFADFLHTEGHVDAARASGFRVGANGSASLGDATAPIGRFRLSADIEHGADEYTLYGLASGTVNRSRSVTRFGIGLHDEGRSRVRYALGLSLESAGITDDTSSSEHEATATSPMLTLDIGADLDSTLTARIRAAFTSTTLRYATATQTPAYVSASGEVEWRAAATTRLSIGLVAASGQNSDSGSSSLVMPRAAVRHDLDSSLMLFAWFAPELRAASYADRVLHAPYARREMVLRPERVALSAAAGGRWTGRALTIEARLFAEKSDGTPVVVADAVDNAQTWQYPSTTTFGVAAGFEVELNEHLGVQVDALFRRTVLDDLDETAPLRPAAEVHARVSYVPDPVGRALRFHGTADIRTSQRAVLGSNTVPMVDPELPARLLFGCGGTYQLLENLQATADITNLLNYKHDLWLGYSAPGFEIRGGIRVTL